MAKAKKLPSGSWRVRVYSHTDAQGKKHYESFTAPTKQQAEMLGAKFAADCDRHRSKDLTIIEAVRGYIAANDGILSPSTINGYTKDARKIASIPAIANTRIRKITTQDAQGFIAALSAQGLSPKTVKNTWGLIRSSLTFYGCDKQFRIHLPSITKKARTAPEKSQIEILYRDASPTLQKCILLGCLSLRRGEISALRYRDLTGSTLYVHSDMVWGADKKWHYKEMPKTDASYRTVYLPPVLVDMLGTGAPDEYIIDIKPNAIGNAFWRLKNKHKMDIRFHDLRHYFATIAQVLQIPDSFTASLGGWRNGSKVLKEVYQNNIVSINEAYAKKISAHIESMT